MNYQREVKNDLEFYPQARERKNKDAYIARKLCKKYGFPDEGRVKDMIQEAYSMDRAWRRTLQLHPRLRGTDYGEKEELEDLKREQLGYNGVNR